MSQDSSLWLPRNASAGFLCASALLIIALSSSAVRGAQPASPPTNTPVVPPKPQLTITAEQEYIIREIIKDMSLSEGKVCSGNDRCYSVPENVKLNPLPPEVVQKVPQAKSHMFFVKADDTIVLVSPSDRRVADVLKKKPTD